MKIMIESTELITHIDGVPVRHWKGVTAAGVECGVFVHRLAVHNSVDQAEFDRELSEQPVPDAMPLAELLDSLDQTVTALETLHSLLHLLLVPIEPNVASDLTRIIARARGLVTSAGG